MGRDGLQPQRGTSGYSRCSRIRRSRRRTWWIRRQRGTFPQAAAASPCTSSTSTELRASCRLPTRIQANQRADSTMQQTGYSHIFGVETHYVMASRRELAKERRVVTFVLLTPSCVTLAISAYSRICQRRPANHQLHPPSIQPAPIHNSPQS